MIEIVGLYISRGHNYFGHHGQPPGEEAAVEMASVECTAGRGLRGDRFFDHKEDYKGQITFFAWEVYEDLCRQFKIHDKHTGVLRRNAITRGIDLNTLVGRRFSVQDIQFEGMGECSPCYLLLDEYGVRAWGRRCPARTRRSESPHSDKRDSSGKYPPVESGALRLLTP